MLRWLQVLEAACRDFVKKWSKKKMIILLIAILTLSTVVGLLALHAYGAYLGFKQHILLGLAGIFVPGLGSTAAVIKLVFKYDLMKGIGNSLRTKK